MDFAATDLVFLSRLQFAVTVMFHYLFPPLTIGLGVLLVYMEWKFLVTREAAWERATRFFVKLFAINFVMGVATGIVLEFEFGTNWASFSRYVGDVFGSILAAEGLWAFFLESGFLAILVFGWNRVTPAFHFFATLMVAIGSVFSAVWITIANSWMQSPAGFSVQPILRDGVPWVVDGQVMQRAVLTDFFAALLNPSTANRISHVLVGALVMGGLFVVSVSAWYLLRRKETEVFRRAFGAGLAATVIGLVGAMVTGDANARMVASLQPAKLAAMEALAITPDGPAEPHAHRRAPRDRGPRGPRQGIMLSGGLSMLVYRDVPPTKNVPGLDLFAPKDRATASIVFWSFRAMVFAGSALLLLVFVATYFWYRGTIEQRRGVLWACVGAVLLGVVANQSGWVTAEVGRQPWVVTPMVPRVDPMSGAGGALYLARVGDDATPEFRTWTPGEPGAALARDGWYVAYGHRIVRGAGGQLREWSEGDDASSPSCTTAPPACAPRTA
jgi:cytochrome d ubiquinol oxidase subunit I